MGGSQILHISEVIKHFLHLRDLEVFSLVRAMQLITEYSAFEAAARAWYRRISFVLDGGLCTSASTLLPCTRSFFRTSMIVPAACLVSHCSHKARVPDTARL